jgi:glutamine---fructose-6-phosphate transaminase (isomerizing)
MITYFTKKEILQQPTTWEKTLEVLQTNRESLFQFFNGVKPEEVIFVGCGTSYYISISAASTFMEVTGISAKAVPASEIFIKPEAVINPNKQTLVIGASRSGTTTEVVRALEHVKNHNLGETLAVTAYPESDLVKHASYSIILPHVQEKSVVMTSSFTNIVLSLNLFAAIVAEDHVYFDELRKLPEAGSALMDQAIEFGQQIGENLKFEHYIFLGLGSYYGLACEGMLKMKEMTQAVCEAFNPLEFRHGPISVLNDKCMTVLLSQNATASYDVALIKDLTKHGSQVVVLGENAGQFKGVTAVQLESGFSDHSRSILYLIVLQWMAYYRTLKLGLNPDEPRNLSQVVKL